MSRPYSGSRRSMGEDTVLQSPAAPVAQDGVVAGYHASQGSAYTLPAVAISPDRRSPRPRVWRPGAPSVAPDGGGRQCLLSVVVVRPRKAGTLAQRRANIMTMRVAT